MKKTVSILLALMLVLVSVCTITTASAAGPQTMYITSANGKSVNVRSGPGKQYEVIGSLRYGEQVGVDWTFVGNPSWAKIVWGGYGDAFVMTQFLTDKKPGPRPTPAPEPDPKKAEREKYQAELNSERSVEPYYIVTQPSRSSGWVNFRSGPSKTTSRIASFVAGKELMVNGETTNWYRATDPVTGNLGYIHKNYATRIEKQIVTEQANSTEKLGRLTVNGDFELTCKLPADYKLQTVDRRGENIVASVLSDDMTKPQMYLTIAFDDTYAGVEKMNDMSEEELKVLENSFTEMNEVNISYGQTGLGTKLMIARETGADTDFVDILTVYKGYLIEFNMSPNPKAADQTLTDEQVQMCVDFLTNIDFVPAA